MPLKTEKYKVQNHSKRQQQKFSTDYENFVGHSISFQEIRPLEKGSVSTKEPSSFDQTDIFFITVSQRT